MSSNRGSAPGERRGGRNPGTPNKKNRALQEAVAAGGITPLEFLLGVMRGEPPENSDPTAIVAFTGLRFEAAKAAAPYVHPRLAATEITGKDGGPLVVNVVKATRKAVCA